MQRQATEVAIITQPFLSLRVTPYRRENGWWYRRALAVLDDGRPAPDGTADQDLYYPCCFRDASEIRRVTDGDEL